MTSDFERKTNPYGTAGSTGGTPAEITVGGDGGGATQTGFGNNTSIRDQGATSPGADGERAKGAIGREAEAAKAELGSATQQVKDGAASLAATAREKASESVEAGKSQLTSSLGDFAAAVRKASDELGERDQSMAAGLVREVANGLEQATGSIEGRSIQDITRSVAAFARRQPTTFLVGAALAGIALGRFARASGEHASAPAGRGTWNDDGEPYPRAYDSRRGYRGETRYDNEDDDRGLTSGRSAPSRPVSPPVSAGTTAPRTTSGAYVSGASASTGAGGSGATTPATGSTAPAEGPSGAVLGHGSGSFNPQGGRDVR